MESNNLERRVRILEQDHAAHRERMRIMEEMLRQNERAHGQINVHLTRIENDIHTLNRIVDKTTTKVSVMVVGASIVVSAIISIVHFAIS